MAHLLLATTYMYKNTRFWPEGGMIWVEDTNTGEATAITRKQALMRAKGINDMIEFYPHTSERDEQHKLVSDLIDCVRRAKEQGDPADPQTRAAMVRDMQRSRKASVLLPSKGFNLGANATPLKLPGLSDIHLNK